ncbi:MAG: hypothetical protein A2X56_08890 [Nitrospirae bacterium GWC2_57_13]|nr:MAG: hypothetical protein A2X56_08890 [Nitrospirae bacterium GWC2_57_13]
MKKVVFFIFALTLIGAHPAETGTLFPVTEYATPDEAAQAVANRVTLLLHNAGANITAAVLAEDQVSDSIISGIVRRLSDSGRVIVIDRAQAGATMSKSTKNGTELAQEVMAQLKLQGLIVVRSWPGEGRDLLAVRIFTRSAAAPETMLVALKQERGQEDGKKAQPLIAPAALRLELAANYELPIAARYMAVIDLEGDGVLEYAFSDGKRLYLYRRDNAAWKSIWTGDTGDDFHYYLDAGDMNGNERPEIFVVAMKAGKVVTTAYEEKGGAVQAIAEIPGFARVLARPGRGLSLLRQDFDKDTYFAGTPRIATWSAGRYVEGEEFLLPKGIGLYDFVLADFGEQSPLLVSTESEGHAAVYSRGALVWKSEEWYRGAETVLVEESKDIYSTLRKVAIRGRLIAADLTGRGRGYVVFPKNKKVIFGPNEGAFHVFAWTGARLERIASLQDLPGPVLDMQAMSTAKDGSFIYVLSQVEGGMFSGPGARLLVYQVL